MAATCGLFVMSACAMAQAEYLDMTRVTVRGDKIKDYEDAVKKLADVNRRYKGDRWIALSTEYGDFGGYTFSSTRENLAGVEEGMGAFQKALKEGLGPLGDKLMRDLYGFSAAGHNELRHRRWDLSVNKPSSTAELMKMVAGTRWIRVLTVDLKPGRNMEYAEAWKPFGEELAKVTPAVPIMVSESATGSPAMYMAVYFKSWAEMDASNAGVQAAFRSAAYARLTKVNQEAVVSSRWEVNRVRPDLSNPPDDVVQADPTFWKPKPAAAAAPKPPEKK